MYIVIMIINFVFPYQSFFKQVMISDFKDAQFQTCHPIEFESDKVEFNIADVHVYWTVKGVNSPIVSLYVSCLRTYHALLCCN